MSGVEKVQFYSQPIYSRSSDRISDAIFNELKKYGVSVSSVSSEAEAKEAIKTKKSERAEEEKRAGAANRNSEKQVIQDLKTLASTLGVSVTDSDSIKVVLSNLEGKINAQLSMCEALQDNAGLTEIKDIQSRYIVINQKANNVFSNQSMLNLSIDSLATTNKVAQSLV